MMNIPSAEFANLPAYQALVALELPAYNGVPERSAAVQAISGLLVKMQSIDRELGRSRAVLIVLQPDRDGRVDLRLNRSRSIEGGITYCFVKWCGSELRQYARKLPTREAHLDVAHGRESSCGNYVLARRLVRRITKLLSVRADILKAIYSLRKANRRIKEVDALEELNEFSLDCTARALTLLAIYATQPINADIFELTRDSSNLRGSNSDAMPAPPSVMTHPQTL